MMEEPSESIGMQKMQPIYTPPGSSRSSASSNDDNPPPPGYHPPGYDPYPRTPPTSPPGGTSPSSPPTSHSHPSAPPAASSPEGPAAAADRPPPPSRPYSFGITLLGFFLVMVFGYFLIAYVVIPGWKEVVKEAERIEAKMRGGPGGTTSEAAAQFADQSRVGVVPAMSNLPCLKEEQRINVNERRSTVDMTPTETAEVYHVSNRIVVPQLTGTAVPTGIDVDELVRFFEAPPAAEKAAATPASGGFVVEEMEDTSKNTSKDTSKDNSDDGGDKKVVNNKRDLNNNNNRVLRRSRGLVAARRSAAPAPITISPPPEPTEKPSWPYMAGRGPRVEPKFQLPGSGWLTLTPVSPARPDTPPPSESSNPEHELKEEAEATTHEEMVEVTKNIIEEMKNPHHTELPAELPVLVLQPPGGRGAVEQDSVSVSNDKRKRDHHLTHVHDPVPATKSKSKPESPKKEQEQKKTAEKPEKTAEKKPEKQQNYHRPDLEAKKNEKSPLVQAVEDVANRFGQKNENFKKHDGVDRHDWAQPPNPKHADKKNENKSLPLVVGAVEVDYHRRPDLEEAAKKKNENKSSLPLVVGTVEVPLDYNHLPDLEAAKKKRDEKSSQLALQALEDYHHHPDLEAAKKKRDEKSSLLVQALEDYHRPDLEQAKKINEKSPLVQAVEDVANRFGQKNENFNLKHEGGGVDRRDWAKPQPPNPNHADPTPREPQSVQVNLGENYGSEGLHKVQGTVHLPDGRTYYPYGDHYKFRRGGEREQYGWPTQAQQSTSREWATIYPHGGRFARRAPPAPTTAASHQYGVGAAAPESSSIYAPAASTSHPETQGQGYPAKNTHASASAASASATPTAALTYGGESHHDAESHLAAASYPAVAPSHPAAAPIHASAAHHRPEYWPDPFQKPDGKHDVPTTHGRPDVPGTHGRPDVPGTHGRPDALTGTHGRPDVVPTHDNGMQHHGKDEGKQGKEDNGKGKGKFDKGGQDKAKGKLGSFHSRRSPASPVGVTHLDWANDIEYTSPLVLPRAAEIAEGSNNVNSGGKNIKAAVENVELNSNDAEGGKHHGPMNADGSLGQSGQPIRHSEPQQPEVQHGDGDGDHKATPLHPNPKVKGWKNRFRGRLGGGGVDHRNKGEKEKESETGSKESYSKEKKLMVKAMKCGLEIVISKTSASGSSVTATASLTVTASPNKWWTPHPHLKTTTARSSIASSATTPTPPPSAPATATMSKPTTPSKSPPPSQNNEKKNKRASAVAPNDDYNNGPPASNKLSPTSRNNEKKNKRATVAVAVAPDYNNGPPASNKLSPSRNNNEKKNIMKRVVAAPDYNAPQSHREQMPEEANKPELMDAKYDYWEFKGAPPDIYYVSDQDSPFNPLYAGAREKKKKQEAVS